MSTTTIRYFNEEGLNEFERIIGEIRNGTLNAVPEDLVYGSNYTELLDPEVSIEMVDFKNKKELVPYLTINTCILTKECGPGYPPFISIIFVRLTAMEKER